MTFISGAYISGAHFVINRAWALHHKLCQSELLTGPQLRHPDDSVEGLAKQAASPPEVRHTQGGPSFEPLVGALDSRSRQSPPNQTAAYRYRSRDVVPFCPQWSFESVLLVTSRVGLVIICLILLTLEASLDDGLFVYRYREAMSSSHHASEKNIQEELQVSPFYQARCMHGGRDAERRREGEEMIRA